MKGTTLKFAVLLVCAGFASACGDVARQGQSPVQVVVNSLEAASGAEPDKFGGVLLSDVITNITSPEPCSPTSPCPTIYDDPAEVTMSLALKDPGTPLTPSAPSALNQVTFTRYRVTYRRSDGRNTPGVDVPHPIDSAVTFTVPNSGQGTGGFEIVRHTAKKEAPLAALAYNPTIIATVADVTFYGRDQAGHDVIASGSIGINFGNFGDPPVGRTFMRIKFFVRQIARPVGAVALAMTVSGCNLENQAVPAISGPSEFGLALTFSATPDAVARDGASMSVVTMTARDASGNPAAGQRVKLALAPEYGGTLSPAEVVTGSDGRATFEFMAPPSNTPVDVVSIVGTPVGQNFDNSSSRSLSIRLLGPGAADAAFIASPSAPERLQPVTFDATDTTVSFATCGDACTYTWRFGDASSATGRVATHQFSAAGTYQVQLTVSHPDRPTATATQTIVVSEGTLTPRIKYSPTDPQPGNTVYFDARDTITSGGATIAEYAWDYGNGSTGTGVTGYATYQQERTYVVRLTVRDSFGRTATTTEQVMVTFPDAD